MKVLVLNAGSSSLKYELYDMSSPQRASLASGLMARIGEERGEAEHHFGGVHALELDPIPDHDEALARVIEALEREDLAGGIGAIGHRVVHGGETFTEPTRIDDRVLQGIRAQIPLAPLHNPANVRGIEVARDLFGLPQVAVFDTAFHSTMPAHAYRYAVPGEWYDDHAVRRYGFHGTSHAYVTRRAAEWLDRERDAVDLVTLHLGNGASACAVAGGRSVDTSMGLSPLEGLVMGTRSGDVDPAVIFHVQRHAGLSPEEVEATLNTGSGLKGLCGAGDLREIEQRAVDGDEAASLALSVYAHRVRKYVGAYLAVLGGADAIVFTAGVGENSASMRQRVCAGLERLGVVLDTEANGARTGGQVRAVHSDESTTAVLVVPTDEELEIAEQTVAVVG